MRRQGGRQMQSNDARPGEDGEPGADLKVGDLVASFGFEGVRMPADQNAAAWREAMATLFDIDELSWNGDAPFRADLDSFAMGPILFGLARAGSQRFRRTLDTIARSGVDHILVQLYSRGGFEGTAGEHAMTVRPGDLCVFDLAQMVETRAVAFENLNMVIPRPMLAAQLARPEALHGLVLPSENLKATVLAHHFRALYDYAPRMTYEDAHAVADGSLSLVLACLRGELERRDAAVSGDAALSLFRIRHYIESHLAQPDLSAETVASHFGLSRASLYRLFSPLGGVADYIRSRRLHRAFFDLAIPGAGKRRISDVAKRWCLGSEANFTRAFKTAYGITPRAAREISILGGRSWQRIPDAAGEHQVLTRWMLEIAAPGKVA
jgi:AraC-like DNA-binding protein